MRSRPTEPPRLETTSASPEETARPRRHGVRRWLVPFLLGSLLVHLTALLAFLFWPHDPGLPRGESSQQVAIELTPDDSAALPPPAAVAEATPPATPPPPPPMQPEAPTPPAEPSPPPSSPVEPAPAPPPPPPPPTPPPPPMSPPEPEPEPAPTPPPPPIVRPQLPQPRPPQPPQPQRQAARPQPRPTPPNANPFTPYFMPPTPRTPPPKRYAGGAIALGIGPVENYKADPPRRSSTDADSDIQVIGAPVGSDWEEALHAWWVIHRRYPQMAADNNEQGNLNLRFTVDRGGHVSGVEVVSTSGSQWLDMAALGTFRNARLPPLPTNMEGDKATMTITISYILLH